MSTLGEFLARLQQVETIPCPSAEEWADLINRISVSGRIVEIPEDAYSVVANSPDVANSVVANSWTITVKVVSFYPEGVTQHSPVGYRRDRQGDASKVE